MKAYSSIFAILVLLLLAGCQKEPLPELPPKTGEGAPPAPSLPQLKTLAKAEVGPASFERASTGSLHPLHEASLGPKETGVIQMLELDEGDTVKKGQVLFRLDASQFELAVAQARAALAGARVQQASAKLDHERTKALKDRGSIAQDPLDQSKARLDGADVAIEQAQATLGLAQKRLANMVVTSPIDGVVAQRLMNVGETATLMPPSIVLVVQDIDVLELRARLPETALRTLSEGTEIRVRLPALDEERAVKIKRIAPTIDARTRTIGVVAELDNHDHRLKAGMLAEVLTGSAETERASNKSPENGRVVVQATTAEEAADKGRPQ